MLFHFLRLFGTSGLGLFTIFLLFLLHSACCFPCACTSASTATACHDKSFVNFSIKCLISFLIYLIPIEIMLLSCLFLAIQETPFFRNNFKVFSTMFIDSWLRCYSGILATKNVQPLRKNLGFDFPCWMEETWLTWPLWEVHDGNIFLLLFFIIRKGNIFENMNVCYILGIGEC